MLAPYAQFCATQLPFTYSAILLARILAIVRGIGKFGVEQWIPQPHFCLYFAHACHSKSASVSEHSARMSEIESREPARLRTIPRFALCILDAFPVPCSASDQGADS